MDKYRFDIDAFLRAIILFGFTILLIWLISTQQLSLYINPKFEILVELSAVVLVLMCIAHVPNIIKRISNDDQQKQGCTHIRRWAYIPFFMVLLLALLIPTNILNANFIETKGLNGNLVASNTLNSNTADIREKAPNYNSDALNANSAFVTEPNSNLPAGKNQISQSTDSKTENFSAENPSPIDGKEPNENTNKTNNQTSSKVTSSQVSWESLGAEVAKQTGLITVTQSNFVDTIHEVYDHQPDYLGREISITGFVYRNPKLADNQFVLVRYLIVCCAADASPYGLLCEIKDTKKYPQGTWLSVRGVIKTSKINNTDTPTISISSVEQVEKPQNPYVFLTN